MWLLLTNYEPEWEAALLAEKIPCLKAEIEEPEEAAGIAFPSENLDQVAKLLGFYVEGAKITVTKTNVQGVGVFTIGEAEVKPEIHLTEEEKEKLLQHTKEAYIKECGKRLTNIKAQTEQSITEASQEIQEASRRIVALTRRIEELEYQRINPLTLADLEGRFATEFDNLLTIPEVASVRLVGGSLVVHTTTIYIHSKSRKKTYEMGEYIININIPNGRIKIENPRSEELTGHPGLYHPHASATNICWGNITETIFDLLAKYEYHVLVQAIIEYLKTCNYEDTLAEYWRPMEE